MAEPRLCSLGQSGEACAWHDTLSRFLTQGFYAAAADLRVRAWTIELSGDCGPRAPQHSVNCHIE